MHKDTASLLTHPRMGPPDLSAIMRAVWAPYLAMHSSAAAFSFSSMGSWQQSVGIIFTGESLQGVPASMAYKNSIRNNSSKCTCSQTHHHAAEEDDSTNQSAALGVHPGEKSVHLIVNCRLYLDSPTTQVFIRFRDREIHPDGHRTHNNNGSLKNPLPRPPSAKTQLISRLSQK